MTEVVDSFMILERFLKYLSSENLPRVATDVITWNYSKKRRPVYHKSWICLFIFFHIIYENTYVYVNLSSKDILKLNFNWISTDFSFNFITFYPLLIFLNSLYARIKSLFSLFMAKVQLYAKTLYIKFAFSNAARINHELIFLLCEKGKLICFLLKLFLGKYFFLTNTCYLFFFFVFGKLILITKEFPNSAWPYGLAWLQDHERS